MRTPIYVILSELKIKSVKFLIGLGMNRIWATSSSSTSKLKDNLLSCTSSMLTLIPYLQLIYITISSLALYYDFQSIDKCTTSVLLANIIQQISHLSVPYLWIFSLFISCSKFIKFDDLLSIIISYPFIFFLHAFFFRSLMLISSIDPLYKLT